MAQDKKDIINNSDGFTPHWGEIAISINCAKINVYELVHMVRYRISQVDVLEKQIFHN